VPVAQPPQPEVVRARLGALRAQVVARDEGREQLRVPHAAHHRRQVEAGADPALADVVGAEELRVVEAGGGQGGRPAFVVQDELGGQLQLLGDVPGATPFDELVEVREAAALEPGGERDVELRLGALDDGGDEGQELVVVEGPVAGADLGDVLVEEGLGAGGRRIGLVAVLGGGGQEVGLF